MSVPNSVKFVQQLILRAKELETADPVISYFCKLHAIQQILASKLHLEDAEVAEYAGNLLDEIETMKTTNAGLASEEGRVILQDDTTAQAYVDGFALKVFAKADKDIYNKTSTRATATTFMAAATFYDVLKVFDPQLDKDVADKIKYAKFQAARILRALKQGQDPNDYEPPAPMSEPEREPESESELVSQAELPSSKEAQQGFSTIHTEDGLSPHTDKLNIAPSNSFSPSPSQIPASRSSVPLSPAPSEPPVLPTTYEKRELSPSALTSEENEKIYTKEDAKRIMNHSAVISNAQKHAKFAISALNYEDISTALKELSEAMDMLKGLD